MSHSVWCVEFEHPDHGVARVFFRWEPCDADMLRVVPIGVEFDLFTPDSEREVLLELLEGARIDRSVSVSALARGPRRSDAERT